MTELSPAAQAVVNAVMKDAYGRPTTYFLYRLALTLRAAADQVLPEDKLYATSCCEFTGNNARAALLAIAAEFEAQLSDPLGYR